VSGTGIDDSALPGRQCGCLDCGGIWQAKDGDVGLGKQARTRTRILALRGIDFVYLDIVALRQTLGNLQTGGAGLPVDEYLG
jgi:hypothetical protein